MANEELNRAAMLLEARAHWQTRRREAPMTPRERLSAAWAALVECKDAVYGALRGWRI